MRNLLALIGLLVIIAAGVWWYLSRPVKAPTATPPDTTSPTTLTGDLYGIDSANSEVKFSINEILRDKPFTAVGTTQEVSGTIAIDGNNLKITPVSVNARTFKTDSAQRDGAIARLILKSESPENEYITFTPTGYNRLPETLSINTELSFQVLGDLTISGITKPAVFDVTMQIFNDEFGSRIEGIATTMVKRSDFDLKIPSIPFVASVDETFPVTVGIVANKAQ